MGVDLIKTFCEGNGKRFGGKHCRYYEQHTRECYLLKKRPLYEVFEEGRCDPSNLVKISVEGTFKAYRDVLVDFKAPDYAKQQKHDRGLIEQFVFEVTPRIQRQPLKKHFSIYALKKYISQTVLHEVWDSLEEMGKFLKRICRNCIHLSPSKEEKFICRRETFIIKEAEVKNRYYAKKVRPSDTEGKTCKGGFEPLRFESLNEVPSLPGSTVDPGRKFVLAEAFGKRTESAENADLRKIYKRQYVELCEFIHWLDNENSPSTEWRKKMIKLFGISERQLLRDLSEIISYVHELG